MGTVLSIFTAVRTQKYSENIQDMLGYLALIIEARMEYEGDGWLGYDRRFRQNAAASPDAIWARIEARIELLQIIAVSSPDWTLPTFTSALLPPRLGHLNTKILVREDT